MLGGGGLGMSLASGTRGSFPAFGGNAGVQKVNMQDTDEAVASWGVTSVRMGGVYTTEVVDVESGVSGFLAR